MALSAGKIPQRFGNDYREQDFINLNLLVNLESNHSPSSVVLIASSSKSKTWNG